MVPNAKGDSEEPCDCFFALRTICGSAYKLFMAAYCCSTLTFWLLTHLQPSPAHLSLFKAAQTPLRPPARHRHLSFCPPCDSAHLFFSSSFFSGLNLCPTSQEAACFTSSRETKSDFKTLLHFSFLPVCLSLSHSLGLHLLPPPPHFLVCGHSAHVCVWKKKKRRVGVEGLRKEGPGWGWGVTSHNHQSERYQGWLS